MGRRFDDLIPAESELNALMQGLAEERRTRTVIFTLVALLGIVVIGGGGWYGAFAIAEQRKATDAAREAAEAARAQTARIAASEAAEDARFEALLIDIRRLFRQHAKDAAVGHRKLAAFILRVARAADVPVKEVRRFVESLNGHAPRGRDRPRQQQRRR